MKAFTRHLKSGKRGHIGNRFAKLSGNFLVAVLMMCCLQSNAQSKDQVISITGTQFTYPLIERWITEYSKINPQLKFKLINDQENSDKADLKIIAHTPEKGEISDSKTLVKVGRFAILPITSEKNQLFTKEFKKGVKQDGLKAIFIKEAGDLNSEEKKEKEPQYTVYTKTPQSCAAKVISSYLGYPSDDLNGIYVTGDDSYLITSLLEDSTGVSYNNLGNIYNLEKRTPISGIKVLPIDLNNNGRLDKEEQIYGDIDQVITYLEDSRGASIPTDNVSFVADAKQTKPEVSDFLNWVKVSGQEFNHQYGFLINANLKNNSLTQK
jgi:ABC-type phosphate transport system substrate-binding protein